jgi:hypothetical protein
MALEYRLARYCMTHPDFYEGVRALIVDKDNAPRWSPATLAEARRRPCRAGVRAAAGGGGAGVLTGYPRARFPNHSIHS